MSHASTPQALDAEAAKQRLRDGYLLPSLPETEYDEWDVAFDVFARTVAAILRQRIHDCFAVDANSDYTRYSDASIVFDIARSKRDTRMISVYHRLLIQSLSPLCIKPALEILTRLDSNAYLTENHVAAYSAIKNAVLDYSWRTNDEGKDYSIFEQVTIDTLSELCFRDFSPERTAAIVALIERGITHYGPVLASLTDFTGVPQPLLEGIL